MSELTPDDVRHWDISVINQMFETAAGRRNDKHQLGEALLHGRQRTADWGGEGAEAFRAEENKTRTDVNAAGRQSDRVYKAAFNAVTACSSAKVRLDDVEAAAGAYGWTVTEDWKLDSDSETNWMYDPAVLEAERETLQEQLDEAKVNAQLADHRLAVALRAAVGDAEVNERGYEVNGQQPQVPTPQAPPPVSNGPPLLTADELHQIFPTLPMDAVNRNVGPLNEAMRQAGMTSPESRAAFLATFAVESGELKYSTELRSDQSATEMYGPEYAGVTFGSGVPHDPDTPSGYQNSSAMLGNTQPGDGDRFRGRGPIQLTGRNNYTAAGDAIGVDLVKNPELAADPRYEFQVATWFWNNHMATLPDGSAVSLNQAAETGNFEAVTRAINGGLTGYSERLDYFNKAVSVLSH